MNAPALVAPASRIHVVFVHGLFSGPDVWKRFADLLEEDFGAAVCVECFSYDSPVVVGSPARRVPEPDDIADALGTFLQVRSSSWCCSRCAVTSKTTPSRPTTSPSSSSRW